MDDNDRNPNPARGEQDRSDSNLNRAAEPGAHPGGYGPSQGELGESRRGSGETGEDTDRKPPRDE